ncbi:MAG: phosphoribosylformylglycinamidine synthase I [Candidatus Omnitrophica bacterium]|nr:phosphoribosylformylglycinamidine synthase I [Candidatus Omnitrophota bacterium]
MNIRGKVKVLVLRTAGTNCDKETAFAFEQAGARSDLVHINRLIRKERTLLDYHILALPGGFSYGDDIASGKILANEIRFKLLGPLMRFIKAGRIVIGICNGFQVLVKAGILPNLSGGFNHIEATLSLNDSAKFEDRWVYLKPESSDPRSRNNNCIWTRDLSPVIYLPVAHAEGKFIPKDSATLKKLEQQGQITFRYSGKDGEKPSYPFNPNGSVGDIAGMCDPTGRVFGLMPHPERHIRHTQHPFWTRIPGRSEGDGMKIFRNGVEFIRKV